MVFIYLYNIVIEKIFNRVGLLENKNLSLKTNISVKNNTGEGGERNWGQRAVADQAHRGDYLQINAFPDMGWWWSERSKTPGRGMKELGQKEDGRKRKKKKKPKNYIFRGGGN